MAASLEVALQKVFLVLPAYNEAGNLPKLLDHVSLALSTANLDFAVVVVDDGSTDGTEAVLEHYAVKLPLHAFKHEQNQGLGPTIRDCLLEASNLASAGDIIVSMDADQSHNPGLIPRMVNMIREGHDIVIASRYQPQARVCGLAAHRVFISWCASILFRILFPIAGVRDYTCGFRAYRAGVLKQAFETYGERFVDQQGFQCMVDILLKLRKLNCIMGEAPMILRYDLKEGASKMKLAKTAFSTFRLIGRRLMNS